MAATAPRLPLAPQIPSILAGALDGEVCACESMEPKGKSQPTATDPVEIDGYRMGRFDQIDAQNAPSVSGRFGATMRSARRADASTRFGTYACAGAEHASPGSC